MKTYSHKNQRKLDRLELLEFFVAESVRYGLDIKTNIDLCSMFLDVYGEAFDLADYNGIKYIDRIKRQTGIFFKQPVTLMLYCIAGQIPYYFRYRWPFQKEIANIIFKDLAINL